MKKVLSLVLALTLVLALCVPAFAAERVDLTTKSYTIEISGAQKDHVYRAWRVFDLVTYDETNNAYIYHINPTYAGVLTATNAVNGTKASDVFELVTIGNDAVCVQAKANVTEQQVADAAKAMADYAKSITADGDFKATANANGCSIAVTGAGYYVVDTTFGALVSADTTNTTIAISEKNKKPTLDKEVQEDSTGNWGATNNASVGDVVNFKLTVHAHDGADRYIVTDTLSAGLTFDATSVVVTDAKNTPTTLEAGADKDYVLAQNGQTFTVSFNRSYLDTINDDRDIVITYSARLNESAVVDGTGNNNVATLKWGDQTVVDSEGKPVNQTPPKETVTYTYDFQIEKWGLNANDQKVALSGAHFNLLEGTKVMKFLLQDNGTYRYISDNAAAENVTLTDDLVSDANGMIKIEGLDADTYTLRETKAPAGYNLMGTDITVVINDDGEAYNGTGEAAVRWTSNKLSDEAKLDTVPVENQKGVELPSTGGIGTTIFYVIGGMLVLAAAVLLVAKKKVNG